MYIFLVARDSKSVLSYTERRQKNYCLTLPVESSSLLFSVLFCVFGRQWEMDNWSILAVASQLILKCFTRYREIL